VRTWSRSADIVALVGLSTLVAGIVSACATQPSPYFYDAASTASCLSARPASVAGLPPANPLKRPTLFVYSPRRRPIERYSVFPNGGKALLAFYGDRATNEYRQVLLIFFPGDLAARHFYDPYRDELAVRIRNVVVQWDRNSDRAGVFRRLVLGCLKTRRYSRSEAQARRPSLPKADLTTFVGSWGGHTRQFMIRPSGHGSEYVSSGCCYPIIKLSFEVMRVSGTVKQATATIRVTAVNLFHWTRGGPRPHLGQIGRLVLKDGIVTDNVSGSFFCSDSAWGATAACGA
jgi:hypothetical protein